LIEKTVDLDEEHVFEKLKDALLAKNCKITAEKPPETISAKQGSLWGMSPRTAKKTITWQLSPAGSKTRIAASSSLSSDWKNITIVGSALSIVVVAVCLWISADLESFLSTLQPSWWSWIVASDGVANAAVASSLITLARVLAVFLGVVVALEAVIYVYAKRRIDLFAEETLKQMA
jgi:hypothetical protein